MSEVADFFKTKYAAAMANKGLSATILAVGFIAGAILF